jgi:hypothetical protein
MTGNAAKPWPRTMVFARTPRKVGVNAELGGAEPEFVNEAVNEYWFSFTP